MWKGLIDVNQAMQLGSTRAEIGKRFGSNGTKLFAIIVLDLRFPNLELLELDAKHFKAIPGGKLSMLLSRSDKATLKKLNQRQRNEGRPQYKKLTEKEFKELLVKWEPKIKMMKKTKIEIIAGECPCRIVRDIATAILMDDDELISFYAAHADQINGFVIEPLN